MLALLAIFLLVRGRIRVHQGFSGRTILRFSSFERFVHWLTATCFIVLALSGLNVSFGRILILPLFGADAFAAMSAWAKLAHNYLAFPFMLGLVIMFLIWIKDNIPGKLDLEWIKQGGGILFEGKHPPAKRFNAGQKGIFWIVIIGGALMSVSGWFLLFPYCRLTCAPVLDRDHAVIAMSSSPPCWRHLYSVRGWRGRSTRWATVRSISTGPGASRLGRGRAEKGWRAVRPHAACRAGRMSVKSR